MLMPSEDGKSQMKSLTMEFILSVVLFYIFFPSLFLYSRNCGACHKAVEIKMRRKENKNLQQCKKRKSLHFAKFISRNANNIYTQWKSYDDADNMAHEGVVVERFGCVLNYS